MGQYNFFFVSIIIQAQQALTAAHSLICITNTGLLSQISFPNLPNAPCKTEFGVEVVDKDV